MSRLSQRLRLKADDLDALPADAFAGEVAPLFEGAPGFLRRLAADRPFGTDDALFERARSIAQAMPEEDQLQLLDAHPRLGAPPALVSELSFREQGYERQAANDAIGEDDDADATARTEAELAMLNDAYETHFGFRYCVFVAGRPRDALLPGMRAALGNDRQDEIRRALDAVVDIARDRYRMLSARDQR